MGFNERWGPQEKKNNSTFQIRRPDTGCVKHHGRPFQASIISNLTACFRALNTGRVTGHRWLCHASVSPPLCFSTLPLGFLTRVVLYDTGGRVRWLVPLQFFSFFSNFSFPTGTNSFMDACANFAFT